MLDKELEWVQINEVSAAGTTMTEYIDTTGKWCKQVWDDGFVEIYKIES